MGQSVVNLVLVAVGGALGAVSRYVVSGWVSRALPSSFFPWGTLVVNSSGSFVLGLLLGLVSSGRLALPSEVRLLVAIGGLGAFTTFSTFAYETLEAARIGDYRLALANVGFSLGIGLLACWAGLVAGQRA